MKCLLQSKHKLLARRKSAISCPCNRRQRLCIDCIDSLGSLTFWNFCCLLFLILLQNWWVVFCRRLVWLGEFGFTVSCHFLDHIFMPQLQQTGFPEVGNSNFVIFRQLAEYSPWVFAKKSQITICKRRLI